MAIRSVQAIQTLELPELAPYRTLRQHEEHRRERIFVAEGEKVVRRLFESSLTVLSALMPEPWFRELEPLIRARPEPVAVYTAPKKLLEQLTGFTMYQGLLAVARMPPAWSLAEALARTAAPRLWVAVEGLTSAENLGALVRNGAALRAQVLVVGETCSSPWLRRAVRASMGAIFHLPTVEPPSLCEALHALREAGVLCVAAHPHTTARTLSRAELTGDVCLVFGSEGYGLSPQILAACDAAVAVPMPPPGSDAGGRITEARCRIPDTGCQRAKAGAASDLPGGVAPIGDRPCRRCGCFVRHTPYLRRYKFGTPSTGW